MKKNTKIIGAIGCVVCLVCIVGYTYLDYYVLNKPTLIVNTMEKFEKYTPLSYETLIKAIDSDSSYDTLEIFIEKDEVLMEFEAIEALEEPMDLVYIASRKGSKVEHRQQIQVEDTIQPVITIQYDGNTVSETLRFDADHFDITKLTVKATDERHGETIELEHDYKPEVFEASLQNPGDTPLTVSVSDGVFEVSQTLTITIDAPPVIEPTETIEAPTPAPAKEPAKKETRSQKKSDSPKKTEKETQNKKREPSSGYVDAGLGRAILNATNRARQAQGIAPVAYDAHIQNLAIERTHTMNRRSGISHDGVPAGYAENLHFYAGNKNISGDDIVNAFLNSPRHRAILLDPDFTKAGMAVIVVDKYYEKYDRTLPTYYAVQLYAS